jgi:NAD(P)-dependent dehydrogenase (short-subunit alcohol dehydrogenase family)
MDRPGDITLPLSATTALITGGGRGLGQLTAQALARAGASVGLVARTESELDTTVRLIRAAGGTAMAATADVCDEGRLSQAVATISRSLGPIDVLVNNAGINGPVGAFADVDPVDWWRTIEVNLGGAMRCMRLVLGGMRARHRGRIINITSVAGTYRWPTVSAYAISKGALVKATENIAAEVRRYGVSVFSFHPGLLPIGLAAAGLAVTGPADSPAGHIAAWARAQKAAGRFSDPSRAADYIVSLASGVADALTGRHLTVDDDLDDLLAHLDALLRFDLHTLRVRAGEDIAPTAVGWRRTPADTRVVSVSA